MGIQQPAIEDLPLISDADFRFVTDTLFREYGIHLEPQKRTLVAGRLNKRLRVLGLSSFAQYFDYLRADASGGELIEFVNRLTTNHSFFFREKDHFDYLKSTVFPAIAAAVKADPSYPVRIWSAGCAAGEEVYTTAIALTEYFGPALASMDVGLIATDISLAALAEAQRGVYPENRFKETPKAYVDRYFSKAGPDSYEVSPELRRLVLFKKLNLMSETFPFKGRFDAVFCRNVMIYFNADSRSRLVAAIHRYVKPGGHFFIGHSESLPRASCPFEYVRPAIYRKGAD